MKRFVYFVLFIMILSLFPVSARADTDVMQAVKDFIAEHGNGSYSADMKGGGTLNISTGDNYIECWIECSEQDGESFYNYKFSLALTPPFDGDIAWGCLICDENGNNSASGKMSASDNVNSELKEDKFEGDSYLYKSFMQNAHNFRDALILAIANDLNYYFDKNLDYFGINPQFFCIDGHNFGEWVYQKNATKQANGTEKRQCHNCFATEEREVEGTMIQVPEGTVSEQTPEVEQPGPQQPVVEQPEVQQQPETQGPQTQEKTEIEVPDYQFELEQPQKDGAQDTEKPKKALPPYAIPLGIVLAVAVVAVVVLFVIKTKRTAKQDDDEDLFGM